MRAPAGESEEHVIERGQPGVRRHDVDALVPSCVDRDRKGRTAVADLPDDRVVLHGRGPVEAENGDRFPV